MGIPACKPDACGAFQAVQEMGARAAAELAAPPWWSTLLRGEALSVGMQQQVQAEGLHASAERGRGRLIPGDVRLGCQQLAAPVDAAKGGG